MEEGNQNSITLEGLANTYQQMQSQFDDAQQQVTVLRNELADNRNELAVTHGNLLSAQSLSGMNPRKPDSFTGKGSIHSWITHVTNYILNDQNSFALSIEVSYLEGPAHEWWILYKETLGGQQGTAWPLLKEALIRRFESLNRVKIARDKLAKWKQIQDVASFNEDFQKILLDIATITVEEQIKRYARDLKPFI